MNATKLGRVLEAVGEAYEDLRVDYDPPAMYLIAGIAATDASHDGVLGAVMQANRRLDPLVQLKLADRITTRLAAPTSRRSAPQRRSSDAEMIYSTPGRILSVR